MRTNLISNALMKLPQLGKKQVSEKSLAMLYYFWFPFFVAVIYYAQDCSLKEVNLPKQFDLKVFEFLTYRKVASSTTSRLSWLGAHFQTVDEGEF